MIENNTLCAMEGVVRWEDIISILASSAGSMKSRKS
jgi:hypothetical protein